MILTIDTSTDTTVVGVFDPARDELVVEDCRADAGRHGDVLLPRIQQVLAGASLTPADISALAAGVGPGSFTGLRIGLSTAQAWSLAMGIPAFGVVSTEALAWPWLQQEPLAKVVVVTDAFKGEVACAVYEHAQGDIAAVFAPYACSPAEAGRHIVDLCAQTRSPIVIGGGLRRYERELTAGLPATCRVAPETADIPQPVALSRLTLRKLAAGEGGDPRALLPLYVRGADAKLPERPLKL